MSRGKREYHRAFLNSKNGMAAVEVEIDGDYAFLSITDCSRKVQLNFDFDTAAGKREAKKKLDRLTHALSIIGKALYAD